MHFLALIIGLCATSAFASPINRRDDFVTDVVVDDVVVTDVVMTTVYESEAAPSPAAEPVVNIVTTTTSVPAVVLQPSQEQTPQAPPSPPPVPAAAPTQALNKVAVAPEPAVVPSSSQASSTPPASTPTPGPSSSSPAGYVANLDAGGSQYQQLALEHHNIHRANHSASALTWNSTLADYAKTTAETCYYDHSLAPGGGGYGQNIANGIAPGNISSIITNGLYNDEFDWYANQWGNDNPNMKDFEKWGHLSQIIWKDTTSVGCYTSSCAPPGANPQACNPADGQPYLKNTQCGMNPGTPAFFTVCNYYPAGNVQGEYSRVQAPKSGKFVQVTENGVTGM